MLAAGATVAPRGRPAPALRAARDAGVALIDLHTHTTASDGRLSPDELVARARVAGVRVLSVTDHDTLAACAAASAACRAAGMTFVPGVEVTAVADGADVHVLGYFQGEPAASLGEFLDGQRQLRIARVCAVVERLRTLGIALDADAIVQPARDDPRKAAGRPWVARALVAGGHVATTSDAFDRWLARDRPAFVPRTGAPPAEVISRVREAGGIASLAHPGLLGHDEWLPELAAQGLDAVEAFHPRHDTAATARYLALAGRLGLAVTGGSDFHGDHTHGPAAPGCVALPAADYARVAARIEEAGWRRHS